MRSLAGKDQSRREFFRASGRYGLLGLLAVACAIAGRRRTGTGQQCVNRGICSGCVVFGDCGLPQALSARNAQFGGNP